MQHNNYHRQLEAILFSNGDPIEEKSIALAMEIDIGRVGELAEELEQVYRQENSAFAIRKLENCYQLTTREEDASVIRRSMELKRQIPLSQAAMEVLAIVAYNQPVTRSFVEQVRGVDSSSIMTGLAEKQLIEEAGRLDLPGRPIAYRTTLNFLRCFGLQSLSELPGLSQLLAGAEPFAESEEAEQQSLIEEI